MHVVDVHKVIDKFGLLLHYHMFSSCVHRLGLSARNSKLNYNDFLKAFEDGRMSSYGNREPDVRVLEFENLTPTEAEQRLRDKVGADYTTVKKVRHPWQS